MLLAGPEGRQSATRDIGGGSPENVQAKGLREGLGSGWPKCMRGCLCLRDLICSQDSVLRGPSLEDLGKAMSWPSAWALLGTAGLQVRLGLGGPGSYSRPPSLQSLGSRPKPLEKETGLYHSPHCGWSTAPLVPE